MGFDPARPKPRGALTALLQRSLAPSWATDDPQGVMDRIGQSLSLPETIKRLPQSPAPGLPPMLTAMRDPRPVADAVANWVAPTDPRDALMQLAGAGIMQVGPLWHGSPHTFDKFDKSKIGTGEGAQAYGHGLYLAEDPGVAESYKRVLANRRFDLGGREIQSTAGMTSAALDNQTMAERIAADALDDAFNAQSVAPAQFAANRLRSQKRMYPEHSADIDAALNHIADWEAAGGKSTMGGHLYETELPDINQTDLLDWDKPLSEQSPRVKVALKRMGFDPMGADAAVSGGEAYSRGRGFHDGPTASAELYANGVRGIRYLDGVSRGKGQGSHNYVVFDDKDIKILRRNGEPLP